MYLFDASAILNLIKRANLKPFSQGVTLDLAIYESLNAIWKEYSLLNHIDYETAQEYIDLVKNVFKILHIESINGIEEKVFELANKEKLTIYDAAYLAKSIKANYILVTDDEKLLKKAPKYIRALRSKEL